MYGPAGSSGLLPKTLPTTIEEATNRYLHQYENNFRGSARDMIRLQRMTESFILRLRRIAPKFYEEKLPTFVNQACSSLLLCDTNTEDGDTKFHRTHGIFLALLDEYKSHQPSGEVDFANEKRRHEKKELLARRHRDLEKRLRALDCVELPVSEIGQDEVDNHYSKIMSEQETVQRELAQVAVELAVLDGFDINQEVDFALKIPPRSILNKLTKDELKHLEDQMKEFCQANQKDKTALHIDISVIEAMFDKLKIEPDRFQKVQLSTMHKDAMDAFRSHFRELDKCVRDHHLNELLHDKHLMPKSGDPYDPENLPVAVKRKMEVHFESCQKELDEVLDCFVEEEDRFVSLGQGLEEEVNDSGDEMGDVRTQVIERLKKEGIKVELVKEEPRDDYEEDEDDDDDILTDQEREGFEGQAYEGEQVDDSLLAIQQAPSDDLSHVDHDQKPRKILKRENEESDGIQNSDEQSNSCAEENGDQDDDEIECLGIIEPQDKIKMFQLPDEE